MKFNIPKLLPILGIWHAVEVRPFNDNDGSNSGLYESDGRTIHIDAGQGVHLRSEIFLHEYLEGVNDICDLGLKHYQICTIAAAYHDLICNQLTAAKEGE